MRVFGVFMTWMALLWEISRWIFDLAGETAGRLSRDPESPKGVDALRAESENRLPGRVYDVFEEAVVQHRRKEYSRALKEYRKLREIPHQDGPLDLHTTSGVFRHNWGVLKRDIKDS